MHGSHVRAEPLTHALRHQARKRIHLCVASLASGTYGHYAADLRRAKHERVLSERAVTAAARNDPWQRPRANAAFLRSRLQGLPRCSGLFVWSDGFRVSRRKARAARPSAPTRVTARRMMGDAR